MRLKQKINRQERILSRLIDLTYATSDQLKTSENLGSNRNARKILFEMEKDKLIKSVRRDKKIYFVTNKGSDAIGRGNSRLNRSEIDHCLMRNDLYIKLGMPDDWKKESQIMLNGEVLLISDASFKKGNRYYFVEVDNKQSMRTNYDKIKKYSKLFKLVFRQHKYHPTLIWYTLSDVRKNKLKKACTKEGIKHIIY